MIYFRTDANPYIGMGHIMRCLSIADAATKLGHSSTTNGHSISFLVADDKVRNLIEARGYKVIVLHSDYKSMDDELMFWPPTTPDLIIVDSYYVTSSYLEKLRSRANGSKIIYIDDLASFAYPVDVLVNYNAYASSCLYQELYGGEEVKIPQLILGPTYAPLRSMFRGVERKVQPEIVKNVLISTGGSDELHLALSIVNFLCRQGSDLLIYHILLGAMNTDKDEIRSISADRDNIVLHENVTDMRNLIQYVDIAISAAGSTMYEICACGIPLITYVLADNQTPGAEAFDKLGLALSIGDLRDPVTIDPTAVMSGSLRLDAVELVLSSLDQLSDDYERRVTMGKQMQKIIDGFGADRLVKEVMEIIK